MRAADDAMDLDRPARVADLELVGERPEHWLLARARQRVGQDRVGLAECASKYAALSAWVTIVAPSATAARNAAGMVEVAVRS